jgi:catechol-2,3-dioxygenase
MVTLPLNVADLMALEPVEPWAGLPPQTILGHIHLHVAAIPPAEAFYTNGLGFDLMQRYGPSASFTSAGGYHHHIAFNVRQVANLFPGLSENPKFNACDRRPLTADRQNTGKSLNLAAVCRRSSAVNWLKSYFRKALNLSPLALLF